MKRKTLLTILFLTLCATLIGCGAETNTGTDTSAVDTTAVDTTPVETTRAEIQDNLPDKDYGGADFTILYRNEWEYEFLAEELTGEAINDAIYNRNHTVEERFDVTLQLTGLNGGWGEQNTFLGAVNSAVMAGDSTYDMIAGYQAYMVTPAMEGYLLNIEEIPYIDSSAPWWSEKCNDSLTVQGKLYLTTGDIAMTLWDNMYVFFFNKDLATEYSVPDLYEIVEEGQWTLDKLKEIAQMVSVDADGNGVYDANDVYGFLSTNDNHVRTFIVAAETPITRLTDTGTVELCFNTERTQNLLEKLLEIYYDQSCYFKDSSWNEPTASEPPKIFAENRALLLAGYLGNASNFRDLDADFGILPYPKFDEDQAEYRTTAHNSVSMICFPIVLADPEMSGILTEALCAESYRNVIPQFYDVVLKSKEVRDAQSAEMIDLIRDSLIFDFGWVHSVPMNSIGTMLAELVRGKSTSFASEYAKVEKKVLAGLDTINEAYAAVSE